MRKDGLHIKLNKGGEKMAKKKRRTIKKGVKVLMWEIFHAPKKKFVKKLKSVAAARKLVKEWNIFKNPQDRIGIIKVLKK